MAEPTAGTRSLVAPRALVPGALAVVLGVVAHVVAGGAPVGPLGLLLLVVLLAPTTALALRGRPSRLRLVAVVVVTQALVHGALLLAAVANRRVGAAAAALESSDGMLGMPGMDASMIDADSVVDAVPASGAAWSLVASHLAHDVSTVSGVVMLVGHLVAAVLLGLWLARGEQLLVNLRSLALAPWVARALRRSAAVVVLLLLELARRRELLTSWRSLVAVPVLPRTPTVTAVVLRGPPSIVGVVLG